MITKFQEFWLLVIRGNSGFGGADSTKVTMTLGNIRKLVAKAHEDGFHNGMALSKSLEGLGSAHKPNEDLIDRLKRRSGQS